MSDEVLKYVGLKLNKMPRFLEYSKPKYKAAKSYDDSGLYKVYREIPVNEIEIFISDTDRLHSCLYFLILAAASRFSLPLKFFKTHW